MGPVGAIAPDQRTPRLLYEESEAIPCRSLGRAVTMPELCCRLETTTATETKDSGYVVAALAGGDLLTNLENATVLTGRSVRRARWSTGEHLHRAVMRSQSS